MDLVYYIITAIKVNVYCFSIRTLRIKFTNSCHIWDYPHSIRVHHMHTYNAIGLDFAMRHKIAVALISKKLFLLNENTTDVVRLTIIKNLCIQLEDDTSAENDLQRRSLILCWRNQLVMFKLQNNHEFMELDEFEIITTWQVTNVETYQC